MKRRLKSVASLLAAVMMMSFLPIINGLAAGGVSISGTLKPGYTITASYDGEAEYAWYSCETEEDEGVLIGGASGSSYKLTNADGEKYIKCVAVVGGESVKSNALLVDAPLKKYNRNDTIGGTPQTNVKYKFSLADDPENEYILLDTTEDDTSKFYIMTAGYYGNRAFGTAVEERFDPGVTTNIAHWLNNSFKTEGNGGKRLPQSILDYIDYDHEWLTDSFKAGDDYLATCGISFISLAEMIQYLGKYGYGEFGSSNRWWTRSTVVISPTDLRWVPAPMDPNGKIYGTASTDNSPKIRPVFYLGKDFFENVPVNVESMGTEVKNAILASYDKEDLQDCYTEEELLAIGFDPESDISLTVSGITVNGTLKPGYPLTGEYTWDSESAEATEGSMYKWYRCATSDDIGTVVGNAKSYTLTNDDGGKYIRFEVIPKNINGLYGAACSSSAVLVDEPLRKLNRTDAISGGTAQTNAIYKFSLSDDSTTEYILLDTTGNDASKFYVMTAGYFGNRSFDTGDGAKFDPDNTKNIASWLNTGFKTDGVDGKKLPQSILNYINYNQEWLTDAIVGGNDYLVNCGISLISINEAIQYAGKYGYAEFGSNRWWTRSTVVLTDGRRVPAPMDTNGTVWGTGATDNTPKVRPVFYLGKDFFKNVSIDIDTMGLEVRNAICASYNKSDLKALYTEEQLIDIGFSPEQDDNLVVSNVTVNGTRKPGYTLSGGYTWIDSSTEQGSLYKWYRCNSANDGGTMIGTGTFYTLTNDDGGKYIRFEVIPKNADSVYGAACSSIAVKVDEPLTKLSRTNNIGGTAQTNTIYKFSLASDSTTEYILLDTSENNKSKFYVMTADAFGVRAFDSGNSSVFNPNNSNNIAYWLNHAFKTEGGGGKVLPDSILGHIDHEHEWLTDAVVGGSDYLVTCGISLISIDEAIRYAGKYGYNEFSNNRWWTRSTVNLPDGRTVPAPIDTNGTIWGTGATDSTPRVRPVFWLDRDFFKTVKLNLQSLSGDSKVIQAIVDNYARDELSGIYSEEELGLFGYANCDVYDVIYTDVNNKTVEQLTPSVEGLTVSARFASYSKNTEVTMIVSLFDKNGGMYGIGIDQKSVVKNVSDEFIVDLSDFDIQEGTTLKVMFWDNFKDMLPLVGGIDF